MRFDDLVQEAAGLAGVAAEEGVEVLLPFPHAGIATGDDHLAVEVEGRGGEIERHALAFGLLGHRVEGDRGGIAALRSASHIRGVAPSKPRFPASATSRSCWKGSARRI